MIRNVFLATLWLATSGQAIGGLIVSSYDVGSGEQTSFTQVQAISRNGGDDHTLSGFAIPWAAEQAVGVEGVVAKNAYALSDSSLAVSFIDHSKNVGGQIASHGVLIFQTTDLATYALSGNYSGHGDSSISMVFDVRLADITSGDWLFQSVMASQATDIGFTLGQANGNQISMLSGSLVNTLLPGHIYQLAYYTIMGDLSPGALPSFSTGVIYLNRIPEPSTITLVLSVLAFSVCRRSPRNTTSDFAQA